MVADISASTTALLTEFLKTPLDQPPYYLDFPPCNHEMRTYVHDICTEHGLKSYSFGPEDETQSQRRVLAFKEGRAPMDHQLELMDRSLPYKECMRQLALESSRLATEMRENAVKAQRELDRQRRSNKRKNEEEDTEPKKNFRKKLEKFAGDTRAQATNSKIDASYGMVPTAMKMNKRTIEEMERDLREKKLNRVDDDGEGWEEIDE